MRELIVYATPTGPIADACGAYFAAANRQGGTTAQTYPPHCTLTGFFRRTDDRTDEITTLVQHAVDQEHPLSDDAVQITRMGFHEQWIGLELEAPGLVAWTESLAEALPPLPGEDELRPKSWLHLSLAYGVDNLDSWRGLVDEHFEYALLHPPSRWELALWERSGAVWQRLTH